jgi:nifR3 family TIM-barrel protein
VTVSTRATAQLRLGPALVDPPVVLAPMAGITNVAFRRLCREYGAGLYVCEMITSRALVERDAKTMRMVRFHPGESPRSLQLYGVDPVVVGEAVRMVVAEDLADHVDLNFGCPVPKVTRRGGGAALPWHRRLFASIVEEAVRAAGGEIPVTVKLRKGIDDDHLTFLQAGRSAADAGADWVALHARTAEQMYSGHADWHAIAALKEAIEVPVLGNGDIWAAGDALRMMAETGADGVVVGRGCLGRPWLFGELAAAFAGGLEPTPPTLGQVAVIMRRHVELLVEAFDGDEAKGCQDFRKHVAWYLKGFRVGSATRAALGLTSSLAQLDALLGELHGDQPFPAEIAEQPRGRTSGQRRVALPEGWLDDPDADLVPEGAELPDSGG